MPISLDFITNELKEFYKVYLPFKKQHLLEKKEGSRNKKVKITNIKILAILIIYHLCGDGNFKAFYELYLSKILRKLPEYSWFIKVCHNKRINRHKTFKGEAERGYRSMGWFYAFKLQMIINENGEIARFCFTKGNVLDVNELKMAERLSGMLVGDKGYISQEKHLEKTLLEKRNITETVFSQLKNWGVVNTKIRSYCGWILNALSCLAIYVIQPFKPHLRFSKNLLIRN